MVLAPCNGSPATTGCSKAACDRLILTRVDPDVDTVPHVVPLDPKPVVSSHEAQILVRVASWNISHDTPSKAPAAIAWCPKSRSCRQQQQ
eukprot:CAMPEP_0206487506 /NCGR_PEP_ID=MMETSP0324_2-20121206/41684_1 /ASSEMBLY_ACC=CAM_ASM_000836 /TAXON_ID=2866 /ORGANISM="Crypthecodinium cohnii, Strain Seligo" /LENGTH=89 /DNA_ID=CAMNT_0053966005 /DNA_START=475 /DNA_END=741 /DNA_ORIENTATION=+